MNLPRIDDKTVLKTPPGIAYWPWILEPDTKFNAAGEYKIWLAAESDYLDTIRTLYETAVEQMHREKCLTEIKRAEPPWTPSKDGKLTFLKFKLKASGTRDGETWTNDPPKVFDSRAKLIKPDPERFKLGTGSQVRVFFRPKPYYVKDAGLSLRLVAVQVLKYVEYDPAAALGVEAEDGFTYEEESDAIEKQLRTPPPPVTPITDSDIPF